MSCSLVLKRKAEKFLKNATKNVVDRVGERLRQLVENPRYDERLKPPLQELYKTRVDPYRIAYLLKPCNVIVVEIGERENFYEKLMHSL